MLGASAWSNNDLLNNTNTKSKHERILVLDSGSALQLLFLASLASLTTYIADIL